MPRKKNGTAKGNGHRQGAALTRGRERARQEDEMQRLELTRELRLTQSRERARDEFDHPDETVVEAYIEAGIESTPDEVAEKAGVEPERVLALYKTKRFQTLLKRRMIQKGFDSQRFYEFSQACMHNLMREYYAQLQEEMVEGMPPAWLEKRMKAIKQIDKLDAQAAALRAETAAGEGGARKRYRNPVEALNEIAQTREGQYHIKRWLERQKRAAEKADAEAKIIDVKLEDAEEHEVSTTEAPPSEVLRRYFEEASVKKLEAKIE